MPNRIAFPELLQAGREAEQTGDLGLALARYEAALAAAPVEASPTRRAELFRAIARLHLRRGDTLDALNASEQGLQLAEKGGDAEYIIIALNMVAAAAQQRGDLERAEKMYVRAAAMADALGQKALAATVKQNLATLASIRGDLVGSLQRYRAALADLRAAGDWLGASTVLSNIAMASADLGDWPAAQACLREAHEHANSVGDLSQIARIEFLRADVALKLRQVEEAREHCDRAFELYTRLESRSGLADTYRCYALLYKESGKPALAEAHLQMVAQLARECQDPLLEAEAEYERALVFLNEGRNRDALQTLSRAESLYTELRASREISDIEQRIDRLQATYLQVVRAWGESIEAKDNYTAGHCGRVADYACMLAEAAGFTGRDLVWIRMGAFLHDVGKTAVPEEILNKPGKLDAQEWAAMQRHTVVGEEIIAELNFPFDIRPIVRNHHERWDGSGYPDGLKGSAIPVTARILCVADVYDALTTTRSYRACFTHDQALAVMDAMAGIDLDPALYKLFREKVLGAPAAPSAATPASPV